jgi:hypothetical protein
MKYHKEDITEKLPLMPACCQTCPFKPDQRGVWQNVPLASTVIERTLFKGHQICHGTEGPSREPNHRCRGAFDHNSAIYRRMGVGEEFIK